MSSHKADISEDFLADAYPEVLVQLVSDKSTGANIIWACDDYAHLGEGFAPSDEISVERITGVHGDVIQPRTYKELAAQSGRTKGKAEVFTPSWVINMQNNAIDEAWFGRADVFNVRSEDDRSWTATPAPISFPDVASSWEEACDDGLRTWQSYVRERRLEITCGEAPYLVSRYDATTGRAIPLAERIGILDRKLRVISENVAADHDHEHLEWFELVRRAYQSTYGFELQGDNLLIARENLLFTFFDVHRARYGCDPSADDLLSIAEVIAWNVFQMDGLQLTAPMREDADGTPAPVLVMDWDRGEACRFEL